MPAKLRRANHLFHVLMRWPRPVGPFVQWGFEVLHLLRILFFAHVNRLRSAGGKDNPFEIIWVDPLAITYSVAGIRRQPGTTWRKAGTVEGGDWDRSLKPFVERSAFRALHARFVEGRSWEDTEYYQHHISRLKEGHVRWGCLTREEFDRRCATLDALYGSIQREGYKLQREVLAGRQTAFGLLSKRTLLDEVVVCIGRRGELLFADGQHRLSIAKILGIPRIPARVLIRHKEWQAMRTSIVHSLNGHWPGPLPHALPHPDLRFLEPVTDSSAWAELIATQMQKIGTGRRLLEVGAGISGFFAAYFERRAFASMVWESDPRSLAILTTLRQKGVLPFRIADDAEINSFEDNAFSVSVWIVADAPHLEQLSRHLPEVGRLTADELFLGFSTMPSDESSREGAHNLGAQLAKRLGFTSFRVHPGPTSEPGSVLLQFVRKTATGPAPVVSIEDRGASGDLSYTT